jgi:hypothetical protein
MDCQSTGEDLAKETYEDKELPSPPVEVDYKNP